MEFNCSLSVKSKAIVVGDEENSTFEAVALFSGTEEDYTLKYTENCEEGTAVNTLHYKQDKGLTIKRESSVSSFLYIEPGKKHTSRLTTPYGLLSLDVTGKSINSSLDESGGSLVFEYTTDIGGEPLGEMSFSYTFKKQ